LGGLVTALFIFWAGPPVFSRFAWRLCVPGSRRHLVPDSIRRRSLPADELFQCCVLLPQLRFQRLGGGNVREGDHDAVDAVVKRPVRHDAHREPAPIARGDWFLRNAQLFQYSARIGHQFRVKQSEARSVMGRPTSPGMSLMIFVAWVVNRRTFRSLSKNSVAISVLLSRFFMSLLDRDNSSTRACNSVLTVWSSSFSDCISSLDVVEFFVGGLKFFIGGLHLLIGRAEFFLGTLHFLAVVCSSMQTCWYLCSNSVGRGLRPGVFRERPRFSFPARGRIGKNDHHKSPHGSGSARRRTVRFTKCSPWLVSIRSPLSTTGSFCRSTFWKASVSS